MVTEEMNAGIIAVTALAAVSTAMAEQSVRGRGLALRLSGSDWVTPVTTAVGSAAPV